MESNDGQQAAISVGYNGHQLQPECCRASNLRNVPSRSITMVLPFAAGGPTDTLSRIIAARMQVSSGQPIIIENVSGAAGTISLGRVARAAPDGYTISVGPMNSHVLTGAIYNLSFDLLNDFEPSHFLPTILLLLFRKRTCRQKTLRN